jgi:NADH dehydrogenase
LAQIMDKLRVVIVGGGFAGVNTALNLKKLHEAVSVTLISDKSWHDYKARTFKIIEDGNASSVCIPLSDLLEVSQVSVDVVNDINLEKRLITGESGKEYSYDYLVLASGSRVNFHGVPVIEGMTFTVNSSREAVKLRAHLEKTIESMKDASDEKKISLGHFLIVGGGGTGVEVSATVNKRARELANIHGIDPSFITVDLFHSGSRILNKLKPEISEAVAKRLRVQGVNIFYNRRLMQEHLEDISIGDLHIKADTIIWTAGVMSNALLQYDNGSIDEYLNLKDHLEVYVIGDAGRDEYYGMAQTAIEHAKYVSESIRNKINHRKNEPYHPKPVYYAIPVLSGWAAVQTRHLVVLGWMGWLIRRYVDLRYLVNRLPLGEAWSIFTGSRQDINNTLRIESESSHEE